MLRRSHDRGLVHCLSAGHDRGRTAAGSQLSPSSGASWNRGFGAIVSASEKNEAHWSGLAQRASVANQSALSPSGDSRHRHGRDCHCHGHARRELLRDRNSSLPSPWGRPAIDQGCRASLAILTTELNTSVAGTDADGAAGTARRTTASRGRADARMVNGMSRATGTECGRRAPAPGAGDPRVARKVPRKSVASAAYVSVSAAVRACRPR